MDGATVRSRVGSMFEPRVALRYGGHGGNLRPNRLYPDSRIDVRSGPVFAQFCREAKTAERGSISEAEYDRVLEVASQYGYSLEVLDEFPT